jgi:O-antigen/teichoic acid export membrane protein
MGEGRLNILVLIHVLMAVLNLGFGYVLGNWVGGYGIILAWGLSLSIGSILLILMYNSKIYIGFRQMFARNERWMLAVSLLVILLGIGLFSARFSQGNVYWKTLSGCALLLLYVPVFARNQSLKNLLLKLRS